MEVWKTQLRFLLSKRLSSFTKKTENVQKYSKKKWAFVDSLRIYVRGGSGGQGFPKYGGVGGDGGNVYVKAKQDQNLQNLIEKVPRKRFTAGSGGNSRKFHLLGEPGNDHDISVPVGVVVKSDQGRILGDLDEDGQSVVVALGGKGGNPDNNFLGMKGESRMVTLDLKLIADIGLVGFPNAGKSTFLGAISRAKPKIGEYPFTTIRPQIGTMEYPDFRKITLADLPGLIEGAHVNFGMGHKFLKHVERTKLLLFLVDINGFQLGVNYRHRSAFETVLLLNKELELYQEDLLTKPAVLALNKIDTDSSGEKLEEVLQLVKDLPGNLEKVAPEDRPATLIHFDDIFSISAKHRQCISEMKSRLRELLDIHADLHRNRDQKNLILQKGESGNFPKQLREHAKNKLV